MAVAHPAAFQGKAAGLGYSGRDTSLVGRRRRANQPVDSTHRTAAEAAVAKGDTCTAPVDKVAWAAPPWANLSDESEIAALDEAEILRQMIQG